MSVQEATKLQRTPLFEAHVEAGAKLVPFAGWEMPVQYSKGIKAEHLAVRGEAGLFDVSHMGEIETRGPSALEFLQAHLSNDLAKVPSWGAQYALLCREDGGILDDLITYRLPSEDGERFLTVVNASNVQKDFDWLHERAKSWDGVDVVDRSAEYAMLALQGPKAMEILASVWDGGDPTTLSRFAARVAEVAGVEALVCRTGYTGEDGVELLLAPEDATGVWQALVAGGAAPVGLGARDTLRLEVCYPLYGNDLSERRTPIEAGLGWCCALDKEFVGAETLRAQQASGTAERLAAFVIEGAGIARAGCVFQKDGEQVGEVTSGTFSPCLEIGIGMGYISSDLAQVGTALDVDVRGKLRSAKVVDRPIYRRD